MEQGASPSGGECLCRGPAWQAEDNRKGPVAAQGLSVWLRHKQTYVRVKYA